MKKYVLFACVSLLTLIWACDDEVPAVSDPSATELLAGESSKTWEITALAGTVNIFTFDLFNLPAGFELPVDLNCLKDNEFTFFTNNTFTATEGTVSCADSLDANASGQWTYTVASDDNDPDTLIISTNDNIVLPVAAPLPVDELTAEKLVVLYTLVLDTPVTVDQLGLTVEEVDVKATLTPKQ